LRIAAVNVRRNSVSRSTAATLFPCSRVLEDRFGANLLGMMVLKGQAARLAYISEFIEQAKASGLVQQAIERAGVRGVQVAPGKAN
jgi:polar amino acid transport system substrate-binding protein